MLQEPVKTAPEMTIPRDRADAVLVYLGLAFVLGFSALATANLIQWQAGIPSLIWLGLVTAGIWSWAKEVGGFGRMASHLVGEMLGRYFVEIASSGGESKQIRFGYDVFGWRILKQGIDAGSIQSVSWSTGQATALAGRDMDDWMICVWFLHQDPVKRQQKEGWSRKPEQDLYIVGPAAEKARTEALGLAFIEFLRQAEVALAPAREPNTWENAEVPGQPVV